MRGNLDNPVDVAALEAWGLANKGKAGRIVEVPELAAAEFVIQGNELLLSPAGFASYRASMELDRIEAN
jgi:hypothetical protein